MIPGKSYCGWPPPFHHRQEANQEEGWHSTDAIQGKVGRSIEAQNGHTVSDQAEEWLDGPGNGMKWGSFQEQHASAACFLGET
jgi:hypothetical protein